MKRLSIILKAMIVACIVVGFAACGGGGLSGAQAAKDACACLKLDDFSKVEKCFEDFDKKYKSKEFSQEELKFKDPKFQADFEKELENCPEFKEFMELMEQFGL